MSAPPILAQWDGEYFIPNRNFKKTCDANFVVGQVYKIETVEERSMRSHRRYFAIVNETWKNLPDHLPEQFPTSEHLRKFMLCKIGEAYEQTIVCSSKEEARRTSKTIKTIDDYSIVTLKDNIVIVHTAKSQAFKAMDKKAFKLCSDRILDLCAEMIGVDPEALENHARAA